MINETPYSISVAELKELGKDNIPGEFVPSCHLIYSSPATLSYNSPGAIGFGVKRAALVIPESVMLLVAPACCGRNSTILSSEEGYADRMFYLEMDETDLVTGRHLNMIPQAINEILEVADPRPEVVTVCTTCVDALLATDLESICMDAEEKCGVRVVPSYMYALTREGRKPPMTVIRQTIYSLLEKQDRMPDRVNIMGFFSALDPENEFFALLRKAGIKEIYEAGAMDKFSDYQKISSANFNIVLDKESNFAAEDLKNRIDMPYIELARLYDPEKIHKQYQLFAKAIGVVFDDSAYYEEALKRVEEFKNKYEGCTVAIGDMCNANSFELAGFFAKCGLVPKVLFSNVTVEDFPYINRLADLAGDARVYAGISPSMVHYRDPEKVDIAIGKDACIYCDAGINVDWFSEKQPFGFKGLIDLIDEIERGNA